MNLKDTIDLYAGGPGSGCNGPNCGRKPGPGHPEDHFTKVASKLEDRFRKFEDAHSFLSRKPIWVRQEVKNRTDFWAVMQSIGQGMAPDEAIRKNISYEPLQKALLKTVRRPWIERVTKGFIQFDQ